MQTNLMEETTEMTKTIMQLEAREAPARILQQLQENRNLMAELGAQIRQFNPQLVMTVGRGSSDHAGVFAKYLVGIEAGRPDILAQAEMAKQAGAFCVALVNDETSPLRDIVDAVVPLKAGPEKAVAATKSFLTTLSAIIHLVAEWTKNAELLEALTHLPLYLEKAIDSPAQLTPEDFKSVDDCVVLARGLGYGIAREIALKLKEVCGIHAESFSSAEFLHGPVTLVETKLTILDVLVKDEAEAAHVEQIEDMKRRGADLVHLNQVLTDVHPRLAPLLLLQRFYLDVEKIALARGVNPDAPPGLNKVTRTR